MLVLTRTAGNNNKKGAIVIGDVVTVRVLDINGNQVRIGIDAPKEVNIRRAELAPLPKKERAYAGS